MGYEFDRSEWPVVRFRFIGRMSSEDISRYLVDSTEIVNGSERYACIMDGTTMLVPEVEFVRRQARWMEEHREAMRRVNVGVALVAPSPLVRGLVRAVLYFQKIPVPSVVFDGLEDARHWTRMRLERQGQPQ